MKLMREALAFFCLLIVQPSQAATVGLCQFNTNGLAFAGSSQEQAACLLRFVKFKATGSTPQPVPPAISDRVGKKVDLGINRIRECLTQAGVTLDEFGNPGIISAEAKKLRYFVIHDTSSPEIPASSGFPSGINDKNWSGNKISTGWTNLASRVHFITNRSGQSRAFAKLGEARQKPAVKLEMNSQTPASRKLFVHVENIQPRLKPAGSWAHTAPDPGFSDSQLRRLAQIYVFVSAASGTWLIPAFHFNIDSDLFPGVDVHDDPQRFDLAAWAGKIDQVMQECQP